MTEEPDRLPAAPPSAAPPRRSDASAPSGPSPGATPEAGGSAGERTRSALLETALDLFGRKGVDGTSTRDIAAAAKVNIAGIAYHFGGKAGLHRAVGVMVAELLTRLLGAFAPAEPESDAQLTQDEAAAQFERMITALARFMLARPEAESIARFMVREQMDPTPVFEALYERLIRPRHERMCRLWARAVGADPESEAVIVAVSGMLGQVMFFRVGRATALRRLGWTTIDETNVDRIVATIGESVRATLRAARERSSLP